MKTFDDLMRLVPKLKDQFITAKQAYLARNNKHRTLVIKIDRSTVIFLKDDGTYYIGEHKNCAELRKKDAH